MRLFLAIDIPESDILRRLYCELTALSRGFRTVRPENYHISLKFLGDPGVPAKAVIDCIKDVGRAHRTAELQMDSMGAFPSFRKPSVLWLGSSEGGCLGEISKDLDSKLHENIGTSMETRRFRAHLTIARVRGKGGLPVEDAATMMQKALDDLNSSGYSIPVREFHLYNSTLTPEGPVYARISTFPLSEGE